MQGLTENYREIGQQLLLSQFHHSPKINAFLTELLAPYDTMQSALSELINARHLATATGKQLDGIGDIVGVQRPFLKADNQWYFGFTGQTKAKGFSQAPIRDSGLKVNYGAVVYMSDTGYKRLLNWKIIANNSHGTAKDVIAAAKALYLADKVAVKNDGSGRVTVTITAKSKNQITAFDETPANWIPTAAGVLANVTINYT